VLMVALEYLLLIKVDESFECRTKDGAHSSTRAHKRLSGLRR
jgi:hypothetical protein